MHVLVLNAGSSTLKASLLADDGATLADHVAAWPPGGDDTAAALDAVRAVLDAVPRPDAVGHRVVHGGPKYRDPAPVDDTLLAEVERLDELAPLHNHRAALVMRAGRDLLPRVPHVACFDSAFHATLPEQAWRYALPEPWIEAHAIRRYGFHGLSVAWAVGRTAELLGRSIEELGIVVAHLGSGCSVTAVLGGRSVATSMGYTPAEGLVMGTRSGSVDPGILLHLLRHGVSRDELAEGLAERSGLVGLGGTADMRAIVARDAAGDARARRALDVFAHAAAAGIAAVATALPRLDALVFTGGIGEHAASVRTEITRRLAVLGAPAALDAGSDDAVLAAGPPAVVVVRAREDRVIAAAVRRVVSRPMALGDAPAGAEDEGTQGA